MQHFKNKTIIVHYLPTYKLESAIFKIDNGTLKISDPFLIISGNNNNTAYIAMSKIFRFDVISTKDLKTIKE